MTGAGGTVPASAWRAWLGTLHARTGEKLYVIQADHAGNRYPGMLVPPNHQAEVSHGGIIQKKYVYNVSSILYPPKSQTLLILLFDKKTPSNNIS